MRHIILDTETTGLSPQDGHRVIEIGALEMVNFTLTGAQLHLYINPEREIDEGARAIHGLTAAFLSDKPVFADIADTFLAFIGSDPLVIHNAPFDIGFLNAELARCQSPLISPDKVIDTLVMARQKFPGAQASLDALCRRFQIDNSHRDLHGALIDADLLAGVFIELKGGRQPGLALDSGRAEPDAEQKKDSLGTQTISGFEIKKGSMRPPRVFAPSPSETAAHEQLLDRMDSPFWRQ